MNKYGKRNDSKYQERYREFRKELENKKKREDWIEWNKGFAWDEADCY